MPMEVDGVSGFNDPLVWGIGEVLGGNDEVDITCGVVFRYHCIFWIESCVVKI